MFLILEDMHKKEQLIAMFPVGYWWNSGVSQKDSTDGGEHAVTFFIVKQTKHIILFVLEPSGLNFFSKVPEIISIFIKMR